MKKFASLFLAVLMLAAMLTVFAVPASAEALDLSGELCESKTYNDQINIVADTTVISGKDIVFEKFIAVETKGELTVESGASITAKSNMCVNGQLIVKPGATVDFLGVLNMGQNSTFEISGTLQGKWNMDMTPNDTQHITLLPGGKIEVKFKNENYANTFADGLKKYKTTVANIDEDEFKYLVTAENSVTEATCPHNQGFTEDGKCNICEWECEHEKWNNGKCELCHYECTHEGDKCDTCGKEIVSNRSTGSTLSEGSLTIIVGVACLAVGFLVAMFVFKKKKPATPDGESNSEE